VKWNWSKRQRMTGYLFIAPNMLGILIFFLFPTVFSFVLMFSDWKFASGKSPKFIGLDNFKHLVNDELFFISLKNTVLFLASVPVSLVLAFLIAILLNRSVFLKSVLRAMYFLPYITSGVAVAFVWMVLFQPRMGPINEILRAIGIDNPPGWLSTTTSSMYAIDIIWSWHLIGFFMIIYLAALQDIPSELLEAAKIDGAKPWQTILRIILPLVSPTTLLLMITGFISTVKTFGIIEAVTGGGPGNSTTILSLFVYKTAFSYYEMGYASAISWVLFMIVMSITMLQWHVQKKWVHY
jgi:multiple sugar transport system permease protein